MVKAIAPGQGNVPRSGSGPRADVGVGEGGGAAAAVCGKRAVVAEQFLACLGDMVADEPLLAGEERSAPW
jgi:hypothetical protein